jgi:hypothetical protein
VNEVIRAAAALQAVCVAQAWRFYFIGGWASDRGRIGWVAPPRIWSEMALFAISWALVIDAVCR